MDMYMHIIFFSILQCFIDLFVIYFHKFKQLHMLDLIPSKQW